MQTSFKVADVRRVRTGWRADREGDSDVGVDVFCVAPVLNQSSSG